MTDNPAKPGLIDTNIWLYAFIETDQPEKTLRARELLHSSQPIVSV